ncbi:symmetrical bis(5'-nucleosyl)-tetraphosphatase [Pseudoalteromonas mariniglutinosa]|uniref:symmetrical bis(5'-nucleosyl)-tetraphosphatase n=1 Tax=Pseudoalteromonas mariniglutinosa TaxID=206042 RepID=UPI00384E2E7B
MTDYAIGDLQGCFNEFDALLKVVDFNPSRDHLYCVGDIVARGPNSLACLETLFNMQGSVTITLGNHDLHLMACHYLAKPPNPKDNLADLFAAKKLSTYIHFLQQQPLAVWLKRYNMFISHAGLNPNWSIKQALKHAQFAEQCYNSEHAIDYFAKMYEPHPSQWKKSLTREEKFRYIVNYFTRMRFITCSGELDLTNKSNQSDSNNTLAWFAHPKLITAEQHFVFGHWAALNGETHYPHMHALDTGCVWGGALTMMNLDNQQLFVKSSHSFI